MGISNGAGKQTNSGGVGDENAVGEEDAIDSGEEILDI